MARNATVVLGIGLLVLWIVGVSHRDARWLAWCDLLAAIIAFGGASMASNVSLNAQSGGPIALGLGLFGLWIGSLVTHTSIGLGWANFAFGLAFVVLGALARTGAEPRATGGVPRPA